MFKGGYIILDLSNYELTTGSETIIDGIFIVIDNSIDKPLLISGLSIDGEVYHACFIQPIKSTSEGVETYTFTIGDQVITIDNFDILTVVEGS